MKIYTRMVQENAEPELIVFEFPEHRLHELHQLCVLNDLSEAVIKMPAYERLAWPDTLPTDGFMSAETRSEWAGWDFPSIEFSDAPEVDLSQSLLEVLHVGANGAVHIELRGGPAEEWWSEGLDLKEIAAYAAS